MHVVDLGPALELRARSRRCRSGSSARCRSRRCSTARPSSPRAARYATRATYFQIRLVTRGHRIGRPSRWPARTTWSSRRTATAAATSPTTGRTSSRGTTTTSTRGCRRSRTPTTTSQGDDGGRNWDSDRRLREMEADGVVAEVIFPNTVPPFFPKASLVQQPPGRGRGRPRAAMGRAAGAQPLAGRLLRRRAGPPSRASARSCCTTSRARSPRSNGRPSTGSPAACCCPGAPPGSGVPAALRAGLRADLVGVRGPRAADQPPQRQRGARLRPLPRGQAMFLLEVTWWAHRTLWHLHLLGRDGAPPRPAVRLHRAGHRVAPRRADAARLLPRPPAGCGRRGRFARGEVRRGRLTSCRSSRPSTGPASASSGRASSAATRSSLRHAGRRRPDHVGQRLPPPRRAAGRTPADHLRLAFAGVPEDEVRAMVGANAARVYGFDLDALAPLAGRVRPVAGRGRRAARARRHPGRGAAVSRPSPRPASPALMEDVRTAGSRSSPAAPAASAQALGERFATEGMKVVLADVLRPSPLERGGRRACATRATT